MAKIGPLTLTPIGAEAAKLSFAHALDVLTAPDSAADRIVERLNKAGVLRDDLTDLIRCEPIDAAASGASKLQGLQLLPGDGYLLLCAALASDGHADTISFVHGWPILSPESNTPTVSGPCGESTPTERGEAA